MVKTYRYISLHIIIYKYWHKENDSLITLALFGDRERERELIKSGFSLGLDLTGGMAWHYGYLTGWSKDTTEIEINGQVSWSFLV